MKQIFIISLLVIAVIMTGCTAKPIGTQTPGAAQNSTSKVLFTDKAYSKYSYLISEDTMDPAAKVALSGFNVSKIPNSDGTTKISLIATDPKYKSRTVTLQPGQKLYFVEASGADDSGGVDTNLADDFVVIVDSNGYVVG